MAKGQKYGYRLFTVGLREAYRTTPKEFFGQGFFSDSGEDSKWTAVDDIVQIAESHKDKKYFHSLRLTRNYPKIENYDPKTDDDAKAILLTEVSRHSGRIDFEFYWGKEGSHDQALVRDADKEDVPLHGTAPSNPYRASLFLPLKAGTTAVLAVETRSRMNVGPDLMKYLACLMEEAAAGKSSLEDKNKWWNFTVRAISDSNRLKTQIKSSEVKRVALKKFGVDPLTGRQTTEMEISQHLFNNKKQGGILGEIMNWFGFSATIKKMEEEIVDGKIDADTVAALEKKYHSDSVEKLEAFLSPDVSDVDWDSGSITFKTGEDETKTVSPDNLDVFYIYPLKRGTRPTHNEIIEDATDKIRSLQGLLKIQLDL